MRRLVIALALVTAAGCAVPRGPTHEEVLSGDSQRGDPPANAEAQILAYLRANLKDPDSLRDLSIGPAERWTWRRGGLLYPESFLHAWKVTAQFNAKNSYGGYTGLRPAEFYFRDGRLVASDL